MNRQSKYDRVSFTSDGVELDGWHFTGAGSAFDGPAGRPVVVMAHGLGGTKDSGLEPFAAGLAAAGLDVLAFDYRGFGASGGTPRQRVSMAGQLDDYRAAMAAAARLPGVDGSRLVLWGVSLSGGHVLAAAAGRDDVAAVVSLTPLVDGRAAGLLALKHHPPRAILRSTAAGLRSRVSSLRGREPVMMPIVARPGEVGALDAARPLRVLPGPRRPDLAQRDRRLGRPGARRPPPRQARRSRCAARCSSRSPTSTAARRRRPPPRRPRPAAPRSATTPATTSTSGPAATGSNPRSPTSVTSCGGTWLDSVAGAADTPSRVAVTSVDLFNSHGNCGSPDRSPSPDTRC